MHHELPASTSQRAPGEVAARAALGLFVGAVAFVLLPRNPPTARITYELPAEVAPQPSPQVSGTPPAPDATQAAAEADEPLEATVEDQRAALLRRMKVALGLDEPQLAAVSRVLGASPQLGQGNPKISRHPMSRAECRAARKAADVVDDDVPRCAARAMVPVYDPRTETADSARVCIDRFEFPNVACDYPVVNVRANEASELCQAIGKRLCDAHEWEGACAGALMPADEEYLWPRARMQASYAHNNLRERVWAYGKERDFSACATGSSVTTGCPGGGWDLCGSNTYPAGSFPQCKSPFGVYDQHGNAAEHMSLPTSAAELGGRGETEMKGSWFVFARTPAHEDDCRWRAPAWHVSTVDAASSHRNYHLGFRCCKDVGG